MRQAAQVNVVQVLGALVPEDGEMLLEEESSGCFSAC
jgi:hypothetical protein